MENELRKLQLIELDILKQVLEICHKYHIRYYMLGGTLLGAIRHQGFIPWDDDIDIGMPRKDYELFLQVAEKELKSPYELGTLKNGKGRYYYPRVINTSVKLLREKGLENEIINAWIDIFPLDNVPAQPDERKTWMHKIDRLKSKYCYAQFSYFIPKRPDPGKKWSLKRRCTIFLFSKLHLEKLMNPLKVWKKLDDALRSEENGQSDWIGNYMGYWGAKEIFKKEVYGNGRLYPFEDLQLMGPENYDFVLTQMYGDYMTPPAKVDMDHHMIKFV